MNRMILAGLELPSSTSQQIEDRVASMKSHALYRLRMLAARTSLCN